MYLKSFNYCVSYNLNKMASSRHDADKENAIRTKIPLPKDPLPALPRHLLVDNKMLQKPKILHHRPLKTLNAQSTNIAKAGPNKVVPHKPKHPLNIDTKHVTMRQKSEDWHYTVFNDKRPADKNVSVISSSDDETYLDNRGSQRYFVENKKKNALGAVLSAVCAVCLLFVCLFVCLLFVFVLRCVVCLEPNPVRNIKKRLKRPNSRELQGLSPPVSKQEKLDDKVKRLKFKESIQDRLKTPDHWKRSYMLISNRDYTDDVFQYLLAKEIKPLEMPRTSSITRACVVNWLMKVNGADGNPAIIQTACWYLDSILGIGHVRLDNLQLIAAACFWIAQKLHGPYIDPAMRLVRYSNSAFTAGKLLAAEKMVMIRLKFPNQPIVAQDYITYLSWWCDTHNAGEIEVAATFIVMCGLMVDRTLCDEYPSVIAVAAVRNALLLLRKNGLMSRLQMCNIYEIAEKKATNLAYTCCALRRTVRTVSTPFYEYKSPLEHYGMPPCRIAQRIISAANELSLTYRCN